MEYRTLCVVAESLGVCSPWSSRPGMQSRVVWLEVPCRWDGGVIPIKSGDHDLWIQHAARGGLFGEYFDNSDLLGVPVIQRVDHVVNFTWGTDRITAYGTDYVTVRWTGKVRGAHAALSRSFTSSHLAVVHMCVCVCVGGPLLFVACGSCFRKTRACTLCFSRPTTMSACGSTKSC